MESEEGTSEALLQHQPGHVIQNGQWGGDVIGEDEDLRESRAPSIAYDLGALHTEEEVRRTRCCTALVRQRQGDIMGKGGGGKEEEGSQALRCDEEVTLGPLYLALLRKRQGDAMGIGRGGEEEGGRPGLVGSIYGLRCEEEVTLLCVPVCPFNV